MAWRKPGIRAPGTLGPAPQPNPEPNLALDTFELCRGVALEPFCEILGVREGKSHISWLRWEAKGREKLVAPVQGPSFLEEKTSMLTKFCSNIGSHLAIDVPAHLVSGTGLAL